MAEAYLGQIIPFAGNFEIQNWAFCNGQLLNINQYTALYAVIGTTYGGNGVSTFALPNLKGRIPMHFGTSPSGQTYSLGQASGSDSITLTQQNMPIHTHVFAPQGSSTVTVQAGNAYGGTPTPSGNYLCNGGDINGAGQNVNNFADASSAGTLGNLAGVTVNFGPGVIGNAGGSLPFQNMPPYLALNYQICINGLYPSRN